MHLWPKLFFLWSIGLSSKISFFRFFLLFFLAVEIWTRRVYNRAQVPQYIVIVACSVRSSTQMALNLKSSESVKPPRAAKVKRKWHTRLFYTTPNGNWLILTKLPLTFAMSSNAIDTTFAIVNGRFAAFRDCPVLHASRRRELNSKNDLLPQ